MAEPYRFGGPIPESVQRMRSRRAYRGSSLYATLKKNRRQDFLESPGLYWEQVRDEMGAVIDVRPKSASTTAAAKTDDEWCRAALKPFEHRAGRAGSAGVADAAPPAPAADPDAPR